jgi:hypothetical protein
VNLFGFDQLLPDDGRIAASIWSWAQDKPDRADGRCAVQRPSARWVTRPCSVVRKAACRIGGQWKITGRTYTQGAAKQACRQRGGALGLPRTGYDNARLRVAAGPSVEAWLGYRLP